MAYTSQFVHATKQTSKVKVEKKKTTTAQQHKPKSNNVFIKIILFVAIIACLILAMTI